MAYVSRRPHPALARYVGDYVGYRGNLDPRAVHHGLPSPSATVILAFDQPIDTSWLDGDRDRLQVWRLASGLHGRPALIRTHGLQHGIQLDLTPAGVRTLFGLPMAALAGCLVDHEDLALGISSAMHMRLAQTSSWTERFELLDGMLLNRLARASAPFDASADVAQAWRIIDTCHGAIKVSQLCAQLGRSPRWLSRQFTAEFGFSPKQVARLHRFAFARKLAAAETPLAETALRAGYADQAHLNRDWRELADLTPTEVLGEPFRVITDE